MIGALHWNTINNPWLKKKLDVDWICVGLIQKSVEKQSVRCV